uniref:Calponin-homology (CH) domain-containing protein n=1 Tax=Periophthalmus magnuspinnatus TaxID=409849 RepID=A0A3B4ALW5_9GOBI
MLYSMDVKLTGLPREVLQWILNLQLSVCPKNVRRDSSNGYLVADIFSQYYPKVFLLYSYKNGAALSIKQDNWRRIQKFLRKLNINLSQDLINGTMHFEMGAAEKLLTEIYSILTKQSEPLGLACAECAQAKGVSRHTAQIKKEICFTQRITMVMIYFILTVFIYFMAFEFEICQCQYSKYFLIQRHY